MKLKNENMKLSILLLFLILGFTACTTTSIKLPRQELLQRWTPMRNLESRYEELQSSASLAKLLGMSTAAHEAEELKDRVDLYWMHYYAANVAIANEDMESYEKHLQLSEMEMEAIESMINKMILGLNSDRLRLEQLPRLKF